MACMMILSDCMIIVPTGIVSVELAHAGSSFAPNVWWKGMALTPFTARIVEAGCSNLDVEEEETVSVLRLTSLSGSGADVF